jgi:hypothetical protein
MTDVKTLSELVKTERHKLLRSQSSITRSQNEAIKSISNVVSWRKEGIVYKKNEVNYFNRFILMSMKRLLY